MQGGKIGITLNGDWREPLPDPDPDVYALNEKASERSNLFWLGWFADPIYFGDYPQVMKDILGPRLPTFTPEETVMMKQSSDFFGLNHYSSAFASHIPGTEKRSLPVEVSLFSPNILEEAEITGMYFVIRRICLGSCFVSYTFIIN